MKTDSLQKAVRLAETTGCVFVATSDADGMPHLAAAGKLSYAGKKNVAVTEWFCPGTVANLDNNKYVSIVVWDKDADTGFQLLGRLEKIVDLGVLDGYAPALEKKPPLPQVQRQLLIRIEKILDFKLGPHSDVEE